MRTAVAATAICFSIIGLSTAGEVSAAIRRPTDIPSQALRPALHAFSKERDIQVVFRTDVVGEIRTSGAVGDLTEVEALTQLLRGTGLTFRYLDEKTVTVVPLSAASSDEERSSSAGQGNPAGGSQDRIELEEIIVTGTYIRGTAPVGSPLKVYSREQIVRSGAATVEQFARTMTENFSSLDTTANKNSSAAKYVNSDSGSAFGGAGFDLRGVGASSTLTLLNGNRIAAAGFNGEVVDVSQIPISVIDRIEVLADGASAIYGADAVAGVVNIITRDDFEGAETAVMYGGADDGGAEQLVASQLLGTSWTDGNVLLNYEHSEQQSLDLSARDYLPEVGGPYSLIPESRRDSVFVAARHSIDDRTTFSGNALYGDRHSSSQVHQQSDILVSDGSESTDVTQSGVAVAVERMIVRDWLAELRANYSRVEQATRSQVTASFGDAVTEQEADSDTVGADLLVSGTVAQLPWGAMKGAAGASAREEKFENRTATATEFFTGEIAVPDLSRRVKSAYAELSLPLLGATSTLGEANLSSAIRHDDYSDFGSSTNTKFGASWSPVDGFQVRASYGTSFKAPLLPQLRSPVTYVVVPYVDPTSPTGTVNVLQIGGGNPELHPEESKSFTAGLDLRLRSAPQLSLSLTYFDIDFTDRITFPPFTGSPLSDPIAAPFISIPTLAEVQAIFADPGFQGDFSGGGPEGVGVMYDPRLANIAATDESGVDFSSAYKIETDVGQFDLSLSAARLLKNDYAVIDGQSPVALLNTFARPPKWKGRGGVAWTRGNFLASVSVNYVNSYRNGLAATLNSPTALQRIDSWTTTDLYFSYVVGAADSTSVLRDLTVALSVTNATDEQPPFAQIPTELMLPGEVVPTFDAANASPLGRYFALRLSKQW